MRHVLSVLSKEKVQSNCTKCAIPVMVVGLKAVQILITDREKAKGAFQETGENLVQIAKERHCSKLEYVCAVVEAMERNLASMQTHQKSVKNVVGTTTPLQLVLPKMAKRSLVPALGLEDAEKNVLDLRLCPETTHQAKSLRSPLKRATDKMIDAPQTQTASQ